MRTVNFKKKDPTALELEIARLFAKLQEHEPETEEYDKVSDQLVKLYTTNKETLSKSRVSPDVLAGAVANIAGILLILNFEHANALTSKALGFIGKKLTG